MANLNLLRSNYNSINNALNDYKDEKISHDDILKTYSQAINKLPDYANSDSKTKPSDVKPTTIAAASHNLVKAIRAKNPIILKIDPENYMKQLKMAHKDGNWTLFDYKNKRPVDSSKEKLIERIGKYRDGLAKDMEKVRTQNKHVEQDNELEL